MSLKIKILYLESQPGDAGMAADILVKEGIDHEMLSVNNKAAYIDALTLFSPNIIISDDELPALNTLDALAVLKGQGLNIPLLAIASSQASSAVGRIINIMKKGAYDYIPKENINELPAAIKEALKKHRAEKITANDLNRFSNTIDEVFFSRDMIRSELIQISPGCETVYGYNSAEFVADPELYFKLYHPEDKHYLRQFVTRLRSGEQASGKYRIIHKDGGVRWIESKITPVIDNDGQLIRIDGVSRNITEAKIAEDNLKISEQRYRQIVETAQEGIWIIDEALLTTFVNKKVCDMLGYPAEEIIGKYKDDFKDAGEKQKTLQRMSKGELGIIETHESAFLTKNGSIVFCRVVTNDLFEPDGKFIGKLAMLTDITERKMDEEALKRSEANLSGIIENTNDLVYSLDRNFKFVAFNQVFKTTMKVVYGLDVEQGTNTLDLFNALDPVTAKKWKGIYLKAFEGETLQFVNEYPFGDSKVFMSYSVNPIWEAGRVIGLSCFSRDITRQKLDEEAIKRSAANLTAIIENTTDMVYSVDANFRFITLNNVFKSGIKQGHGLDIEQGDNAVDLMDKIDPERAGEWKDIYLKALHGEALQFEIEYIYGDRKVYLNFSVNPIWETGKVIGLSCFSRNITRQKQNEEAIRRSAANLAAIIENTDASIYSLDTDLRCIAFNKLFKDNLIQAYNVVLEPGDNILDFLRASDPEQAAEWEARYAAALAGQIVQFTKEFVILETPTFISFSLNPIWENDVVIGLSCSARDTTKQKTDEIAVRKSEASLRTIFNNTDMGCVLIDNLGMVVSYNTLAQKFLKERTNVDIEEGTFILDGVEEGRKEFVQDLLRKTKNGSAVNYQLSREVNGITKWYDLTWAGINDSGQRDFGHIFTVNDITKKKKLETEREIITADIIQRNKALEQFTYIISHNLRAPVANIIGLSSLAASVDLDTDECLELVTNIGRSANKLDNVILDLNQVLQVNENLNEKIESISLGKLLDDIRFSIRNLIEKEHVRINYDLGEVEQMLSIKSFIHSIFYNLITNSIKYRCPGIDPLITISTKVADGKIAIHYKDNGRGIDTVKYADELFGLYKRFDTSVEGKGMGLFMVKMQVESLGGTIAVTSALNKGIEFMLEFPQVQLQMA